MILNSFKNWLCIAVLIILLCLNAGVAWAGDGPSLQVTLKPPAGILKMGDTPTFLGAVTNLGPQTIQGLVVYLSLVSLEPGNEQPVDLEDWSAQKAVRISQLPSGTTNSQKWNMRLIGAGKYGVTLTVVNPKENLPVISELIPFDIMPKPTLVAGRILPVAIGEPFLILSFLGLLGFSRWKLNKIHPA